ncbi:MAG: hypothetical protein CMM01_03095 [Rhodopirellula sp.]|nr:hypothetical protein [Rhodopirellula sp.]OUX52257.1 MAG: hypothetical protein CBE43_01050 [Rhodopirellula sp. TMED283]
MTGDCLGGAVFAWIFCVCRSDVLPSALGGLLNYNSDPPRTVLRDGGCDFLVVGIQPMERA